MGALNETKEKMGTVRSVGQFVNALQNIATIKMATLRDKVLASKRFVDESTQILKELNYYQDVVFKRDFKKATTNSLRSKERKLPDKLRLAVVIITSNQGLCGRYNQEIFKKVESEILVEENANADVFILGKKGQDRYTSEKYPNFKIFPFDLGDTFDYKDLARLVGVFPLYEKILFVYSRFVNTVTREVVNTLLVTPPVKYNEKDKIPDVKFLFEPSIEELINKASLKLRVATFQQQALDARLAQYSAQMIGMQNASENVKTLLGDLTHEYNKQRRKIIDKKISEVFAGSALW